MDDGGMKLKKSLKRIASFTLAGVLCTTATLGFVHASDNTQQESSPNVIKQQENKAKNVILLIGDGMGPTQVSAASYLKGDGFTAGDLAMDSFTNIGLARTFSHDSTVTDSAAAATAFSAARKTDNGVLGMAPDSEVHHEEEEFLDVETVLESAEENDLSTGLVTTARITHATPAAFASHIDDRNKESNIAEQMLLDHDINVLFGGGKDYFLSKADGGKRDDDKNLLDEAKKKGYELVENKQDLSAIDTDKILGLFNNSHMNYELDRDMTEEPSLAEMTDKAINILSQNDNGFFLMVEGGRIDHAGHANYPATNVQETLAFDEAIQIALDFAKKDENTLVIVSADHETGGMSIGANGEYNLNKDVLLQVKRSPEYMSKQLKDDLSNMTEVLDEFTGIKNVTDEEKELITSTKDKASAIAKIISERALIGWTTTGHTAVHVPVYSYGPTANQLLGTIDNTTISEVIAQSITSSQSNSSAEQLLTIIEQIESEETAKALKMHVESIIRFEEKQEVGKIVKHLESLKLLIGQLHESGKLSEDVYNSLLNEVNALLEK